MSEDAFARHRSLLFTVAYEMLGSASEAEDVVQEAWLRWSSVDEGSVQHPRAYLVRTVTRQALNRLRSVSRRREDYVGAWLPEPLLTAPGVAADVELAERLSMALLTMLETLAPVERAVFVLREVFDTPYDEIAEAVGKSPAAVRQIIHRARAHVTARRPRVRVSAEEQRAVIDGFLKALRDGDPDAALAILAPDVVLVADGGGVVGAVPRPIVGAKKVGALLLQGMRRWPMDAAPVWLNGAPGLRIEVAGSLDAAVSMVVEQGRITRIFIVRNPHKLKHLARVHELRRR